MKTWLSLVVVLTLSVVLVAAGGCANKNKGAVNGGVTDVSVAPVPPREMETAYAGPLSGAPAPAPAYYEPAVTTTPGPGVAGGGGGGSYTVRKGDTLFSIAKANYGNGNQWQRIASANPGLSPSTLKAGQTIVLP